MADEKIGDYEVGADAEGEELTSHSINADRLSEVASRLEAETNDKLIHFSPYYAVIDRLGSDDWIGLHDQVVQAVGQKTDLEVNWLGFDPFALSIKAANLGGDGPRVETKKGLIQRKSDGASALGLADWWNNVILVSTQLDNLGLKDWFRRLVPGEDIDTLFHEQVHLGQAADTAEATLVLENAAKWWMRQNANPVLRLAYALVTLGGWSLAGAAINYFYQRSLAAKEAPLKKLHENNAATLYIEALAYAGTSYISREINQTIAHSLANHSDVIDCLGGKIDPQFAAQQITDRLAMLWELGADPMWLARNFIPEHVGGVEEDFQELLRALDSQISERLRTGENDFNLGGQDRADQESELVARFNARNRLRATTITQILIQEGEKKVKEVMQRDEIVLIKPDEARTDLVVLTDKQLGEDPNQVAQLEVRVGEISQETQQTIADFVTLGAGSTRLADAVGPDHGLVTLEELPSSGNIGVSAFNKSTLRTSLVITDADHPFTERLLATTNWEAEALRVWGLLTPKSKKQISNFFTDGAVAWGGEDLSNGEFQLALAKIALGTLGGVQQKEILSELHRKLAVLWGTKRKRDINDQLDNMIYPRIPLAVTRNRILAQPNLAIEIPQNVAKRLEQLYPVKEARDRLMSTLSPGLRGFLDGNQSWVASILPEFVEVCESGLARTDNRNMPESISRLFGGLIRSSSDYRALRFYKNLFQALATELESLK